MYSWKMTGAKPVIQDDAGDCMVTIGSSGMVVNWRSSPSEA